MASVTSGQPRKVTSRDARPVAFSEIPVIDIGPLFGTDRPAIERAAARLDEACRQIGFFYIENHRVSRGVIERAYAEASRFFALPEDVKMAIHYKKAKNHVRGYVPVWQTHADRRAKPDLHEALDLALDLPADDPDYMAGNRMYGPNQWPENLPGFREGIYAYYEAILDLGRTLFRGFAAALDLPDDYFEPMITKPMGQMRVIHYPPQADLDDERLWGIGEHTDYECFTVLGQDDAGGLQVKNAAGEWIEAPPIPGAFVVNIGDIMARWTNGIYQSTPHRVLNLSGGERYSLAFFYGSNYDTLVSCLETCRDEGHPAKYPPVVAGEWTTKNLISTYFSD